MRWLNFLDFKHLTLKKVATFYQTAHTLMYLRQNNQLIAYKTVPVNSHGPDETSPPFYRECHGNKRFSTIITKFGFILLFFFFFFFFFFFLLLLLSFNKFNKQQQGQAFKVKT